MKYEEAVEKIKAVSNRQVITKARLKFYSKKPRDNYRHSFDKYNYELQKNKKEINYLLAIIKAHKQARKLYAEVKRLRANFAESVCKECKCEVNTAVNDKLVEDNLRLRAENATLVEVADFMTNRGTK